MKYVLSFLAGFATAYGIGWLILAVQKWQAPVDPPIHHETPPIEPDEE